MDIGARIKQLRERRGLTLEQVGEYVGVNKATVQRYESGEIDIKRNVAIKLAEVLHSDPAYIMGWADELPDNVIQMPPMRRVPHVGSIACGEPILAEQNIEGYDEVPDWVKCDFTLTCKGDSMTGARIHDGDVVCIKAQPEVESGQIAAVLIDGEFESEATLKRVRYIDGGVVLMPENTAFAPMIFVGAEAERVHILGLATHLIGKVV